MRTPTTWQGWNDLGKSAFAQGDYRRALDAYQHALEYESSDAAVLHSNIAACHLHLQDPCKAVEEAQKAVALKPRWAKAHVRLASAYSSLGDHSNQACQSLQTALRLDPRHPTARDMLLRELRRDSTREEATREAVPDDVDVDEPPPETPWWQRSIEWYKSQSEDVQMALKIVVVLVVLYVAFGGRFGFEGTSRTTRGHYGSDNPYVQYRKQKNGWSPEWYRSTGSSQSSNDTVGMLSWIMIGGAGFYAARYLGVHPMHALWIAQAFIGRRRPRRGYGYYRR